MRNVDAKRLAVGYRIDASAASRRVGRKAHKEEKNKKQRKFGAVSQRNGITVKVFVLL